jgi:hypothetical protein
MLDKEDKFDSIVESVIGNYKTRANVGQTKYGTNLDRTDLNTKDWIEHLQQELMDAVLYLEKLKQNFKNSI